MSELDLISSNVLDPQVIKSQGAGKAYQSVATSMAIAAQDATDYLRTMSVITQAATAVCITKLVQTKDPRYVYVLGQVQQNMVKSVETFSKIVEAAGTGVSKFPSS